MLSLQAGGALLSPLSHSFSPKHPFSIIEEFRGFPWFLCPTGPFSRDRRVVTAIATTGWLRNRTGTVFPETASGTRTAGTYSRNRNRNRSRPFLLVCTETQNFAEEPPEPRTGTARTVPPPNVTEPNLGLTGCCRWEYNHRCPTCPLHLRLKTRSGIPKALSRRESQKILGNSGFPTKEYSNGQQKVNPANAGKLILGTPRAFWDDFLGG